MNNNRNLLIGAAVAAVVVAIAAFAMMDDDDVTTTPSSPPAAQSSPPATTPPSPPATTPPANAAEVIFTTRAASRSRVGGPVMKGVALATPFRLSPLRAMSLLSCLRVRERAMLDEGDKAPDFELPTESGDKFKLSGFKGKAVVLYFYPKDDTSGCTLEAKDFSSVRPGFPQGRS